MKNSYTGETLTTSFLIHGKTHACRVILCISLCSRMISHYYEQPTMERQPPMGAHLATPQNDILYTNVRPMKSHLS